MRSRMLATGREGMRSKRPMREPRPDARAVERKPDECPSACKRRVYEVIRAARSGHWTFVLFLLAFLKSTLSASAENGSGRHREAAGWWTGRPTSGMQTLDFSGWSQVTSCGWGRGSTMQRGRTNAATTNTHGGSSHHAEDDCAQAHIPLPPLPSSAFLRLHSPTGPRRARAPARRPTGPAPARRRRAASWAPVWSAGPVRAGRTSRQQRPDVEPTRSAPSISSVTAEHPPARLRRWGLRARRVVAIHADRPRAPATPPAHAGAIVFSSPQRINQDACKNATVTWRSPRPSEARPGGARLTPRPSSSTSLPLQPRKHTGQPRCPGPGQRR